MPCRRFFDGSPITYYITIYSRVTERAGRCVRRVAVRRGTSSCYRVPRYRSHLVAGDVPDFHRHLPSGYARLLLTFQNPVGGQGGIMLLWYCIVFMSYSVVVAVRTVVVYVCVCLCRHIKPIFRHTTLICIEYFQFPHRAICFPLEGFPLEGYEYIQWYK